MKHPIQPLALDEHGTLRFKENKIVRHLIKYGNISLNEIARLDFSTEDREQFSQLIGYSLSGFAELSEASDETYSTAFKMWEEGLGETKARIAYLQETIETLRAGLKGPIAALYGIHPDDLG